MSDENLKDLEPMDDLETMKNLKHSPKTVINVKPGEIESFKIFPLEEEKKDE